MSLWSYFPTRPKMPKRETTLTPQLAQQTYDSVVKVARSVLRQASLLQQLSLERHSGPYPATPRDIPPDRKWLEELRRLATADASGHSVSMDAVGQVVRTLVADSKQLSDSLFKLNERGKGERWPMPLLSGIKSAVGVLGRLADLELLGPELARVKREFAQLASFCKAFELPQAKQLETASAALRQAV